jgi:streptomycin 6-kinase
MTEDNVRRRAEAIVCMWNVTVEDTSETATSFLFFGTRQRQPVVVKVIKHEGDEWYSGEVLQAFAGNGVVRVYEYVDGALLLERAMPGESLVRMATSGGENAATAIFAAVIHRMAGCTPPDRCPTLHDWAKGFERHIASGDVRIPRDLVNDAYRQYRQLAASQAEITLLHGDLHHYNVLMDTERGWLAIDPKGVVGEVEYELGAIFRNPIERPDMFTSPHVIEARLQTLTRALDVDVERVLRWAFAQAVLSAIWAIDDGFAVEPGDPTVGLACTLRAMLA